MNGATRPLIAAAVLFLAGCASNPREQYADALTFYNVAAEATLLAIETGAWEPTSEELAALRAIDATAEAMLDKLKVMAETGDPEFRVTLAEFLAIVRDARLIVAGADE